MKPIYLSVRAVARNALKHWDYLGAVRGEEACKYNYGNGNRCVIGWSLSKPLLKYIFQTTMNETSIDTLKREKLVNYSDNIIEKIQDRHDVISALLNLKERNKQLKEFKQYLQKLAR